MSEKILNFESGQTGIDQEIALDQSQPELELAKIVKYGTHACF